MSQTGLTSRVTRLSPALDLAGDKRSQMPAGDILDKEGQIIAKLTISNGDQEGEVDSVFEVIRVTRPLWSVSNILDNLTINDPDRMERANGRPGGFKEGGGGP